MLVLILFSKLHIGLRMYVVKLLLNVVFLIFGDFISTDIGEYFRYPDNGLEMKVKKESKQSLFAQNSYCLTGIDFNEYTDPDMVIAVAQESRRNRSIIIIQRWLVIFLSIFTIWLIFLLRANLKSKKKIRKLYADLEQYNKKLEELNTNKDKYLSIISHDLRAPLGSIKELLQIYIDEEDMPDKDQLKVLYAEVDHTNALLEDLLSWSKIQFEKQKLFFETVRVDNIVDEILSTLMIIIHKKRIHIDVKIAPDIVVYADKNMIKMIIRNLTSNALKFTRKDGSVHITAAMTENKMVKLHVKDTGVGIASERLKSIFDPLKVMSTPGTENEIGTGLGLVLCHEFVKLNKGTINIDSQQGVGTNITVLLHSGNDDA